MSALDGMCMPADVLACDEDPEAGEEVCLECVRRDLEIARLKEELLAYRCLNCHKPLPVRSLQLANKETGRAWCNSKCLTEYDRAMSADVRF